MKTPFLISALDSLKVKGKVVPVHYAMKAYGEEDV
jgi:hypothetical protein